MRDEAPGAPALKEKMLRPIDLVILAAAVFLLIGQFLNFQQNQAIQEAQDAGKERTFETRAITRDLSKGIGVAEPVGCLDVEVEKYRDPLVEEGSSASSRASLQLKQVICAVLTQPESTIVLPPDMCPKTG